MRRRKFLRRSALAIAGVVVAGTGVLAWLPGDRSARPQQPLRALPARAFPVLAAVAARVLKGTSAKPLVVAEHVDGALLFSPPEARRDLGRVLLVLESALHSLAMVGRPEPFTELTEDKQDAVLMAWRDGRVAALTGAYHAIRKLILAAHYASDGAFHDANYPGPSLGLPRAPAFAARDKLGPDPVLPDGSADDEDGMPRGTAPAAPHLTMPGAQP